MPTNATIDETILAHDFDPPLDYPIDPDAHRVALRALTLIADGGDGLISAAMARAALKVIAGELPEPSPDEAALSSLDHALVEVGSAIDRLGPCGCDDVKGRMCRGCSAYMRLTAAADDVRELVEGRS